MNLSTWAIRNPTAPIVLFVLLTIAGLFSYIRLPVSSMPSIIIPYVKVAIALPGASSAELEVQVARIVEGSLSNIKGVKSTTSHVSEGVSVTTVEFDIGSDFNRAVYETREAINRIRSALPADILEPSVERLDLDALPVLIFTLASDQLSEELLSEFIDNELNRRLMALEGVGRVQRQGGVDREITVTLSFDKLAAYGLTATEISRQLAINNVDLPGGRVTLGESEFNLRTLGSKSTIEALQEFSVTLPEGKVVKLGLLGSISENSSERRSETKMNLQPVVAFFVTANKGDSEVDVARRVEKEIENISVERGNLQFTKVVSMAKYTETNFNAAIIAFLEGALLTVLVVFIFLKDWRSTLIAAITIPLSIIPTFIILDWMGFSLNAVSLLAISLVTGVLVDDAIVEIENIHRHLKKGESPRQASIKAVEEISTAVIATTLVICAVFVPIGLMSGIVGQYFQQFGVTVAVAAFFSLLVARLLTPLLAAYFLKVHNVVESQNDSKLSASYRRILEWTLSNRKKTIIFAFIGLEASLMLTPFLSTGFLPFEDISQVNVSIELPAGSTLKQTDKVVVSAVGILKQHPEVKSVLSNSGELAGGVNRAQLTVILTTPEERTQNQRELESIFQRELKEIPDVRIDTLGAEGKKDLSFTLKGDDPTTLLNAASDLERDMRSIPELVSVTNTAMYQRQPEIIVTPDFERAAMLGVDTQTISNLITVAMVGDIETRLAKFTQGSEQIPIRVQLSSNENGGLDIIRNMKVKASNGRSIPLSSVVKFSYGLGPATINRVDKQRIVSVEANLNNISMGDALGRINSLPSIKSLPPSVQVLNVGNVDAMMDLFSEFLKAIFTGLLFVYCIMVLLYKDWLHPFTRMAALPLSIGGAFLMLLITGTELNIPALIGLLMLMGIVDKNSILQVDYMLALIRKGDALRDAVINAAMVRARPIIMTSFAMAASMLPIVFNLGLNNSFRAPMAYAVIGGLISSTVLSLILVPVLFSYVEEFGQYLRRKINQGNDEGVVAGERQ